MLPNVGREAFPTATKQHVEVSDLGGKQRELVSMNCPKCGAQMQKPGDQGGSMWVCYSCGTVVQS
ncbi:hypothetical protein GCM10023088_44030 [Actinomadura verrucosospora]